MSAHTPTSLEVEALFGSNSPCLDRLERSSVADDLRSINTRRYSQSGASQYGTIGHVLNHTKPSDLKTTLGKELEILLKTCPPLMLTLILQYSFSLITTWVAGRLGTKELGAASLATMFANVSLFCVYEGCGASLDTLTSQAYGGGRKHLVGLHVQRMCVLNMLLTIPIGAVWMCSPWILEVILPEKELAILSGQYLRIYLIGAPGWALFEAGRRFTQAQGDFNASMWVNLACTPICIVLNWWIVFTLQMGLPGAALALAITYILQPVLLVIYIIIFAPSNLECWPGIKWSAVLRNWGPMVSLSVPGVAMTLSEWLAFEVLTFSASYLGSKDLAAQSVAMTVAVFSYHATSFPAAIACSVRFGNLIGLGALEAAREACKVYYVLFLGIGLLNMLVLMTFQQRLAALFSKDAEVRAVISVVMPIVAGAQCADAMLAISNGLLRGLGRQKIGGLVNLVVYYLFAIPLSLFVSFGPPKMGLAGLWIGPCTGLCLGALFIALYIRYSSWEKAVQEAQARVE